MTGRFQSLRSRLLLAMIVPALAAIGLAYALFTYLNSGIERAADQTTASAVAAGIARLVEAGGTLPSGRMLQATLPNDQVVITRNSRQVLTGPLPGVVSQREREFTAVSSFRGGSVTVHAYTSVDEPVPYQLLLAAAAPAVLLVLSAVAAAGILSRSLQRQIEHASTAAERVAAGDLSVRMGSTAQGEFVPLAQTFDRMAASLDSADRNQRQFIGDLAHEFATPVNAISGTGLALADGTASSDEARLEAAETLTKETRRLQGLFSDLRNLTRLDIAERLHRSSVSVDRVCADVVSRHRPDAAAAGVHMQLRASSAAVVSDPRLIEMIVENLVVNAIRYTPSGGSITVQVRRQRHEVVVTVRDTGIGIAPKHRERIFDRFYRVDEARQRATGGSGLGLSIARRAAGELGGHIDVTSELGEGSLFRLTIPDHAEAANGATGPG